MAEAGLEPVASHRKALAVRLLAKALALPPPSGGRGKLVVPTQKGRGLANRREERGAAAGITGAAQSSRQ